ncbi:MAG TPA: DMT family transporter [Vicinamibacteria bacterium]|nr:DMT family transporter [Vicinamibacteria bacterium]
MTTAAPPAANRPHPYAVLALAVACVSVGSLLIRLAASPALAVAFYRIALAAALVAPLGLPAARAAWRGLPTGRRRAVVAAGLALALHFATWIASLSYTSVAASVLLVNTAPLFTIVFARVFLGERPTRLVLAAMAIALVGAFLIAAGDWTGGLGSLTGAALAVAGAVTLSAYHVVGRGLRDALPLTTYVFVVWAVAAAALGALAVALGVPLAGYTARTWAAFAGLAVIPTVLGHGLVNRSLRALSAPTVGLFLLGEPVLASLLAWAFLDEAPGAMTLAGGALVLLALVLVVRGGAA